MDSQTIKGAAVPKWLCRAHEEFAWEQLFGDVLQFCFDVQF